MESFIEWVSITGMVYWYAQIPDLNLIEDLRDDLEWGLTTRPSCLISVSASLVPDWFLTEDIAVIPRTIMSYLAVGSVVPVVTATNWVHILNGAQIRRFTCALSFNATLPWKAKSHIT